MLLAQTLGEYGAAGSGVRGVLEGLLGALNTVWDAVLRAEPKTWVMVGGAALVFWFFLRR
jgi:hypothetical protein